MKKGQIFSMEILLVVILLMTTVILIVISQIDTVQQSGDLDARLEANDKEADNIYRYIEENDLLEYDQNNPSLLKLTTIDVNTLKAEAGVRNDFVIYLEKDGKLVKIDPQNNIDLVGNADLAFE
jgi:hypothetical protein